MKRIFYPLAIALIALAASTSCSSTKSADKAEADSLGLDWDSTCAPIPMDEVLVYDDIYGEDVTGHYLLYVMQGQEDSVRIAPVAKSYQTMCYGGKKVKIEYDGIQNGPESCSLIGGQNAKYMKGYIYKYWDKTELGEGDGIAFNDAFLANHKIIDININTDTQKKIPSTLRDSLKTRYKMEIQDSRLMAESKGIGLAVYSVQMKLKGKKALGMHVITVDDQIYVHEEWAEVHEDGYLCWSVDDDGIYQGGNVLTITSGEKGYDVFIETVSAETTCYTALLLRDGQVNEVDMASYYNDIDYTPPFEAVSLPKGSELKAELDGYKVWIHTDDEGDEDGSNAVYSVYYSKPGSKDVYHLVTAGKAPLATLTSCQSETDDVIVINPSAVITAQEAFIKKSPDGKYKLILQGCPDARNIYCFVTSLPVESVDCPFYRVCCFEGFQGVDKATNTLMFDTYAYHDEGGRYTIRKYFSFEDLELVKTEILEDE